MATETVLLGMAFALFAVPASVVDSRRYRVPDVCTLGGTVAVLALRVLVLKTPVGVAIAGPVLGGGLFMLVRLVSGSRLGFGDVKLALLSGATTGALAWPAAAGMGSAAAALWVLALALRTRRRARDIRIPFAPFLTVGTLAALALSPVLSAMVGLPAA